MPTLYMMIGVPGSGKSTWLARQNRDPNTSVVLSTDDIIEREAAAQGKTYNDVFRSTIKSATQEMMSQLQQAVESDMDIFWDQTNATVKSRASKLGQIPDHYYRVAVMFPTPDPKEWERRLGNRPGKTIPWNVLQGMKSQLEEPQASEGFDQVIHVK